MGHAVEVDHIISEIGNVDESCYEKEFRRDQDVEIEYGLITSYVQSPRRNRIGRDKGGKTSKQALQFNIQIALRILSLYAKPLNNLEIFFVFLFSPTHLQFG
ncbi:hypothetical protein ACFX14_034052 [Malus domestica]